ncbi:MAG: short-chain fatty acids transporter [Flavobacteriales bacterium]
MPLTLFLVGKRVAQSTSLPFAKAHSEDRKQDVERADLQDYLKAPALIVGSLMLLMALSRAVMHSDMLSFLWGTPNWINLMLFGFGLVFHGSIHSFLKAIGGASGILIQFPLYFGIIGIVTGSVLVNVFVPSGEGNGRFRAPS